MVFGRYDSGTAMRGGRRSVASGGVVYEMTRVIL
jgi:hypothetical protein